MDSDLTLPATAADALGVDPSDAKLPRLIAAASELVRAHINRPRLHYTVAFAERLAGHVEQVRLRLGLLPVISVASVVLSDGSSLGASEYTVEDADVGVLYRAAGWPFTGLVRAGLLYDAPAVGTESRNLLVTYTGGWVTPAQAATPGWSGPARSLPEAVEEACLLTASALYRRQGADQAVQSESLGDYAVTYRSESMPSLPDAAVALLSPYRRLL